MTKSTELLQGTLDLLILKAISLGPVADVKRLAEELDQMQHDLRRQQLLLKQREQQLKQAMDQLQRTKQAAAQRAAKKPPAEGGCARKPIIGSVSQGRLDSCYMPPLAMSDLAIFQIR